MSNKVDKTKDLISHGGDLAGSAIGGALGFFAGGPVGAALGAASGTFIGKAFSSIGSDIHDSYLSPKEEIRIGAATAIALSDIKQKMEQGQQVRDDGFFEESKTKRSDAEDILEGTLLKCKTAYEEKKVHYGGKFYSNISFREDIDANRASYFLQIFERLTYRQLCLINIFNRLGNKLRNHDLIDTTVTPEHWGIFQEINELKDLNIIRQKDEHGKITTIWGLGAIVPARLSVTRLGLDFQDLFSLDEIPNEDLDSAIKLLL